jgi:catechol 2,3-dioxygenase-like lactoylglutathione lyase family enzyme
MANFIRITPFMHVPDVAAAVRFFVEGLGFKAWIHVSDYAYVQREVAAVRILRASQSPGEEQRPGTHAFRYYIDVEDVDSVLAELKPRLEALGHPGIHGPVDQAYGQREIMILAPDGDLVIFGQSIFEMPGTIHS